MPGNLTSVHAPDVLGALHYIEQGDLANAERLVRARLTRHPDDIMAAAVLAEIAARAGYLADAEQRYRAVLGHAPDFIDARINLARVVTQRGRLIEAIDLLAAVPQHHPQYRPARRLRNSSLAQVGRVAEAEAGIRALIATYPDNALDWQALANLLKTTGDREGSVAAFRTALSIEPIASENWWGLANLDDRQLTDADVDHMQGLQADHRLSPEQRVCLDFALGKAFEDRANWQASFDHYAAGNALRRRIHPYASSVTSNEVDDAIATYRGAFITDRRAFGLHGVRPIFVVGLPRSGSTLIEQILASHPAIEALAELPYVPAINAEMVASMPPPTTPTLARYVAAIDARQARDWAQTYLERVSAHRQTDRPMFTDKLPNNWLNIGLIRLLFPDAIFVDARRGPMAACFANFKMHFAVGQDFAYDQEDLAKYYCDYRRMMDHWHNVLGDQIITVELDDLLNESEAVVRRLLATIGVPFDPSCLAFNHNQRPVRTASALQVRRPLDPGVNQLWRHYAPWLGPMKRILDQL